MNKSFIICNRYYALHRIEKLKERLKTNIEYTKNQFKFMMYKMYYKKSKFNETEHKWTRNGLLRSTLS